MNTPSLDRRGFLALGVGALAVAAAPPLLRPRERWVRRTVPSMGTLATFAIATRFEPAAHHALDAAVAELRRVESLMTRFRADSDIGRVNRSRPGAAVTVSPETAEVVRDALMWARDTEGRFDPGLARLSELWDPHPGARPPAAFDVEALTETPPWRALELGGDPGAPWLRRHTTAAALDLGGIAKGYGVDRAAAALEATGVRSALVNVGGDLMALGTGPGGRPWRIGVRDPERPDEVLTVLDVEDRAVATSGDYLRGFDHEGRRYHHLLDPATGRPHRPRFRSITIEAPTVRSADAAATAAFALGDDGPQFLPQRAGLRIVHRG
ncbi:MAG: FAD:protein FMN transferase [Gemmatimonadetes bacterium]|nr:FAD:protein FMN transferase [Gemmatimonadota bacterium]